MRVLIALVLGLALPASALAAPMRFDFQGIVTVASGIWDAQGSVVTGYYEYDTDAADLVAGNPGHDAFAPDLPAANQPLGFALSVTVGNTTRTTASNRNANDRHHLVQFMDRPTDDRFLFLANRRTPTDDYAILDFVDEAEDLKGQIYGGVTLGLDPDGVAFGSYNLTDSPPTFQLDPDRFDRATGAYHAYDDSNGTVLGFVEFEVTGVQFVPEPGTASLVGLGLAALSGGRVARRRRAIRA